MIGQQTDLTISRSLLVLPAKIVKTWKVVTRAENPNKVRQTEQSGRVSGDDKQEYEEDRNFLKLVTVSGRAGSGAVSQ